MTAIAIDGPAGAGKSTVARAVAVALGFHYLDTGAMYRAVTLAALERGIDVTDGAALAVVAGSLTFQVRGDKTFIDGRDVSEEIRRPDVTAKVSVVSAHPQVRRTLLAAQRNVARNGDVVMEGRDIGTNVVPDAKVKIYLTATLDERARRRRKDLGLPDDTDTLEDLARSIAERDERDSSRRSAPLSKAPDAIEVDTTDRTIEEVVDEIVRLAKAAVA